MTAAPGRKAWTRAAVRTRLAAILSAALAPVLLLGAVQSYLITKNEALSQRAEMTELTRLSAGDIGARIASIDVVMTSLVSTDSVPGCGPKLADTQTRMPFVANIVRFDGAGAVVCAARPLGQDPERARRVWFDAAASGSARSMAIAPAGLYDRGPALISSIRSGVGGGVMSALIPFAPLMPPASETIVTTGAEMAFLSVDGKVLTGSRTDAFPVDLQLASRRRDARGFAGWPGRDRGGQARIFAVAALPGQDGLVAFSAPRRDVLFGGALNPLLAIGLPIFVFALALVGVWIVADQTILRWMVYLQRIAAIYARGRYGIHASAPRWAPVEIRDLAESLDSIAATITARDRTLRENLVHRDALLREIHHRVKNNLQVISSLLNMQQRALVDPAARAAISDTRQRISALALIYRALYEGPDLRKVDLRQFLEDLIGQLMVNDVGRRATIRTHLSIDALSIDPDQLPPLSLFAVEAITNARKHGVGDAGEGRLEVIFRVRDAEAELTISDSGHPGAPAPVVGEGVGRTLMTAFARQLAGQALFYADADGMTVKLRFPVALAKPES